MHEQRLTVRMLKYWNLVRKTAQMPAHQHFNVEPINDLWDKCFLVSVDTHGKGLRYKYEYVGSEITEAYGRDLTFQSVNEDFKRFPGVVMYKKLDEVGREHRPVEDAGFFVSESGRLIKYRACFLPLGSQKKGLTHIVVGLSFRVF